MKSQKNQTNSIAVVFYFILIFCLAIGFILQYLVGYPTGPFYAEIRSQYDRGALYDHPKYGGGVIVEVLPQGTKLDAIGYVSPNSRTSNAVSYYIVAYNKTRYYAPVGDWYVSCEGKKKNPMYPKTCLDGMQIADQIEWEDATDFQR